jgi:hypothetical protein
MLTEAQKTQKALELMRSSRQGKKALGFEEALAMVNKVEQKGFPKKSMSAPSVAKDNSLVNIGNWRTGITIRCYEPGPHAVLWAKVTALIEANTLPLYSDEAFRLLCATCGVEYREPPTGTQADAARGFRQAVRGPTFGGNP